jgi:hypothetical protein
VKTRLCPPLSAAAAADLYRCFLLDKIEQVRELDGTNPAIAYTPAEGRPLFETLAPGFVLVEQRGGDLGARLSNGFETLFALGYAGVLLVDTDTPTLPARFLQDAVVLIGTPDVDVVLGPCEDGGYYLVGLHTLHRELFDGIEWSTAAVFSETLRRARALGLRTVCLPRWFDVDTAGDLDRLRAALDAGTADEPRHTRRFLATR